MFVLKTQIGQDLFNYISSFIANFLHFSNAGLHFLFGPSVSPNFATLVLPVIVFFCSFMYILYYWGGMQYVVKKLGWFFVKVMDTSGAESVVACASPFVGMGENVLVVKPFIEVMTNSELHSVMTSGFATISGGVLLAFMDRVRDPKTILCACVMSIPAGLLLSKMRYPELETPISKGKISVPESEDREVNFLHAAANGSATGMHLIMLISGALIAIVSLQAAVDFCIGWAFDMLNIRDTVNPMINGVKPKISLSFLLSYVFAPFAWCIGIETGQMRKAAEFMATKMVVNEFRAYDDLKLYTSTGVLSGRTLDLLAFALCGFANLSSIGVQIGCLGALAPKRTADLAKLAFSAMLTGTISTWLSACLAGALL